MKHLLLLGLLLLSLPLTNAYLITEVMYDPVGIDSNREWIEVYGEPLDDIIFIEDANAHSLTFIQGSCLNDCVSIIADDVQQFLTEYVVNQSTLVYDSSWSSLKNTGEYLALERNGTLLVEFFYPAITASGDSLSLVNNTYVSAQPTPGFYDVVEEKYALVDNVSQVPEFGIIGALFVLVASGYVAFRNRQD